MHIYFNFSILGVILVQSHLNGESVENPTQVQNGNTYLEIKQHEPVGYASVTSQDNYKQVSRSLLQQL